LTFALLAAGDHAGGGWAPARCACGSVFPGAVDGRCRLGRPRRVFGRHLAVPRPTAFRRCALPWLRRYSTVPREGGGARGAAGRKATASACPVPPENAAGYRRRDWTQNRTCGRDACASISAGWRRDLRDPRGGLRSMRETPACPNCGTDHPGVLTGDVCPVCGTPLPQDRARRLRQTTILWIDDDRLLLSVCGEAFERHGYRVL
jgi:hypothetical protein